MLSERVALVTGATSGIGASTAKTLIGLGYKVIISGRDYKKLTDMCENINSDTDPKAYSFCSDIRNDNLIPEAFQFSNKIFGKHPDTLIFSAGIGLPGNILNSDSESWKTLVDINYTSQILHLKRSAELLIKHIDSDENVKDIVFLGSTVGRDISPSNSIYGSTKAAMHYLVESLRRELSTYAIRLTLIEPGFVKSEFQRNSGYDNKWVQDLEKLYGPFLVPDDIADTIGYIVTRPKNVHIDNIRLRPTRQVQ